MRGIEKQEVLRRRLVMKIFNAMATDEEQAFLKSSESDFGERLTRVHEIADLVLLRIKKIFEGHSVEKLPKLLQPETSKRGVKRRSPSISFFENQRSSFVKHCAEQNVYSRDAAHQLFAEPDRESVHRWRTSATNLLADPPVVRPPAAPPPGTASQGVLGAWMAGWGQ